MLDFCEALAETMFKFTNIVMHYAPIGVGAAIAYTVGHSGPRRSREPRQAVADAVRRADRLPAPRAAARGADFPGPDPQVRPRDRASRRSSPSRPPSSEAALPRAMEAMERLGVPRRIVAFVLPPGYSFNLDGTTLYLSLASMFVAQAAGVHLTLGQQIIDVLHADADEQRRRRRAARLAGHPGRHAGPFSLPLEASRSSSASTS